MKILHLDDSPQNLRALARSFRSSGNEVTSVATAEEAMAELVRASPDLFISDWNLQYGTAEDAINLAREIGVPVLLHSAMPPEDLAVDKVVTKGGPIQDLIEVADSLIERRYS